MDRPTYRTGYRRHGARFVRIALVVLTLPALAMAGSAAIGTGGDDGGASDGSPWTALSGVSSQRSAAPRAQSYIRPERYQALALDQDALEAQLAPAPIEPPSGARVAGAGDDSGGMLLSLPSPTGELADFRVVESPIMEPGLAAKFPDIRTYSGQGIDDPAATLRFDVSNQGFHAQVLSPSGAWYIDPYYHLDTSVYISYFKRDLTESPNAPFVEQLADQLPDLGGQLPDLGGLAGATSADEPDLSANRSGTNLRIHRAAFAANGEYTAFHGGTVAQAQAAIVTALNRVNGIFEVEVAIRMVLVADNDDLVYTDATTDPYANSNADTEANQTNIDAVIGNADYDIGHVFTTSSGFAPGTVGVAGQKARGTTGRGSPINDPFTVDYVAHEVGHQYNADHTFNGSVGNCGGTTRTAATAVEPGSGSTIMAYAGICGLDNLQVVGGGTGATGASDPYFHSTSFDQIVAHTTGGNPGDLGGTATGNTVPTADAGPDGTIPASTPFLLQGAGTDANGDTITYDWEQRDLGQQRALNSPEITAGPLFRSFAPTVSPIRYLPRLANIAANNTNVPGPCGALTTTIGAPQACWSEFIPTAARTMNFRVTVRDNRAGGGGVNTDDTVVTVANTGAPFAVTSQGSAVTYGRGSSQNVTWNVAGTTAAPVSAPNVNILLSTDGGLTFPTTLIANTANDGSQAVTMPNVTTMTARIMVVESGTGVGVRFFNVNTANFAIAPAATVTTLTSTPNPSVYGQAVTFTATVSPASANVNVPTGTVQFFDDTTLLGTGTVSGNPAQATFTTTVGMLPAGNHSITAVSSGDANFSGSTSVALVQVVQKAQVSVLVTSSQNPSGFGSPVVFTATIVPVPPGAGTPTGTVQFSVDGVPRGGPATLSGAVGSSPAIASLLPGTHTVLARYSGDANFFDGSGGLQQVVTCTKTITGTQTGSLIVGPGSVCIVDATVPGSVQARPGSAVYVARSTIGGSVNENRGVAFAMCDTSVDGSVLITRTEGSVLIGDGGDNGTFACLGNTIGGALSIGRTTGSAEASANDIGDSLSLNDTISTGVPPEDVPKVQANQIGANLACLRNVPAPVNLGLTNTVRGVRSGQCRLL